MNLIWATDEFRIHGVKYEGFPLVLDEEMHGVEPANRFLQYHLIQRGRVGSEKSWKPIGQAIYDYFTFLESKGMAWNDVRHREDSGLVAAYRDHCLKENLTHRNTVRQRLAIICKLYEYALRKGWIRTLPFASENVKGFRNESVLAHLDTSGGRSASKDVMLKVPKLLPKFLRREQCLQLLRITNNPHHKMMIQLALRSGLRREELCTFPAIYVVDPAVALNSKRLFKIRLDPNDGYAIRTKGSKPRDIYITRSLMADLWRYVVHVRGERASLSQNKHKTLFLNQYGDPFAQDGKGFEVIVRQLAARIGAKSSPHMLRHTYATYTLIDLNKIKSGIEPLAFLMRQLGHGSIITTTIYTHLVDEVVDDATLEYDDEITRASEGIVGSDGVYFE